MKNETIMLVEMDENDFTATLVLVSETGQRKEILICESVDVSRLSRFAGEWATFATFVFNKEK